MKMYEIKLSVISNYSSNIENIKSDRDIKTSYLTIKTLSEKTIKEVADSMFHFYRTLDNLQAYVNQNSTPICLSFCKKLNVLLKNTLQKSFDETDSDLSSKKMATDIIPFGDYDGSYTIENTTYKTVHRNE